jgi:hypothetical protein
MDRTLAARRDRSSVGGVGLLSASIMEERAFWEGRRGDIGVTEGDRLAV